MGKTISNLSVGLFGDVSHFAHAFGKKATESVKSWADGMKEAGSRVMELTGLAGLAAGAYEAFLDIPKGFKLAAEFERTSVSLGAMIGNANQANAVLSELREFSVKTPFEFGDLAQAERQLAAFGTRTDDLLPTIRMMANIAAGADTSVGELVQLYIRVRDEGRLSGREIREFTNAGIPLTDALAKSLGKSPAEIRKLLEAGAVTFPQVQKAFAQMTGEGGAFHDMLEKQATTMGGMWTQATKQADEVLERFVEGLRDGTPAMDNANGRLSMMSQLAKDFSYTLGNSLTTGASKGASFLSWVDKFQKSVLGFDGGFAAFKEWFDENSKQLDEKSHPAPKIEPPKPIPVEFNPRVHSHELVRWGSAEMWRLQQEWAGQFPKMVHHAAKATSAGSGASNLPGIFHHNPLLAGFLAQKAGVFGELMKRVTTPPAKTEHKGRIIVGPQPEKPIKPASFEARRKSLLESPTSDYKDSDTYVDSHGKRHHYSASHPNPFPNVITPDNVKQRLPKDAWKPDDVNKSVYYQFQTWQLLQNQQSQVANF